MKNAELRSWHMVTAVAMTPQGGGPAGRCRFSWDQQGEHCARRQLSPLGTHLRSAVPQLVPCGVPATARITVRRDKSNHATCHKPLGCAINPLLYPPTESLSEAGSLLFCGLFSHQFLPVLLSSLCACQSAPSFCAFAPALPSSWFAQPTQHCRGRDSQ